MKTKLAGAFLLFQLGMILSAPWHAWRFWAWAPFHETAWYSLHVETNGTRLTPEQARERYHLKTWFIGPEGENWESNSLQGVFDAIDATEKTKKDTTVQVEVNYRKNGKASARWRALYRGGERVE